MLPRTVDVSAVTSQSVVGSPTSWQTPNGPFNVEHLAAANTNNELFVFWWSPEHNWQAVNVSSKTGYRIAGGVTNWQTHDGPFLVEHLAGRTPTGDLVVFWWSPQHDWNAVNVSTKTGKQISTSATSWVTPDGAGGTVEHLAARGLAGELLVFYWMAATDWQVIDVTMKTGRMIAGEVTSWTSRDGPLLVEHLALTYPSRSTLPNFFESAKKRQERISPVAPFNANVRSLAPQFISLV